MDETLADIGDGRQDPCIPTDQRGCSTSSTRSEGEGDQRQRWNDVRRRDRQSRAPFDLYSFGHHILSLAGLRNSSKITIQPYPFILQLYAEHIVLPVGQDTW
jgi:hypothetical protein